MSSVHSKFFPPARPIARFTRDEIDAMWRRAHGTAILAEELPEACRSAVAGQEARACVRRFVTDLATPHERARRVMAVAAILFGVAVEDILARSRGTLHVHARAYVAHRLRGPEFGWSTRKIGRFLDGRDDTTVRNLLRPKGGRRR